MKQGYTHIAVVLDRSGSMSTCATDTVGGFNAFVEDQKKVPGEATLTLAQFDDVYELVHNGIALKDVPSLDFHPRGYTALLDAIGKTINDTGAWLSQKPEDQRPERVFFVILTDGAENASREFTREQIFKMIRHQEDAYKWQFIFLGANQDAIKAGAGIGIKMDSALTYNASNTSEAYRTFSGSLTGARTSGKAAAFTSTDRLRNK